MPEGARTVETAGNVRRAETFSAYYDQTSRLAYSLALHITGDAEQSSAACESAYLLAWADPGEPLLSDFERVLIERVRAAAIRVRRESAEPPRSAVPGLAYEPGKALTANLEMLEPNARRAIELAYYGGIRVPEIARILGQPVASVRAAMRGALLQLGASLQTVEGTQR